ncbi:MAG: glucose-6-phosphate isomerase [Vicinamibacterales bacterium]
MPTHPELTRLVHHGLASRIWRRETSPFAASVAPAAIHDAIRNRLGWLDAPVSMRSHIDALEQLVEDLRQEGLTEVYLLGMGGSSLCAEVLRDVGGARDHGFRLTVLDTTDERAVRNATDTLTPTRACFLVASKSGSTIEVTSLERHFRQVLIKAGIEAPGRHFVAITDPGTSLVGHAEAEGYRHTFINPPDIGGRYSALSLFGLLPAALCGTPLLPLLQSGAGMADRCRRDELNNPGLELGAFMGAHAVAGRDKLTLIVAPALAPLGPWIEQLVAESTGKTGRGILPVVGEPLGDPASYGSDRAFVAVRTSESRRERDLAARLEAAGHPVLTIETGVEHLGAEFFRWEFATAVAGSVIGVNPFDEPDVRGAKARTQAQLDARATQGAFRVQPPLEPRDGLLRRESPAAAASGTEGDRYFAVLDYLPAQPGRAEGVARAREALRRRTGKASTHGTGPRYLHSTGQYHKGGPNNGVFLLLTAADQTATDVPGAGYTFSTLKQAQAFGDFDALVDAGRTVVHYHVEDPGADFTAVLERLVDQVR